MPSQTYKHRFSKHSMSSQKKTILRLDRTLDNEIAETGTPLMYLCQNIVALFQIVLIYATVCKVKSSQIETQRNCIVWTILLSMILPVKATGHYSSMPDEWNLTCIGTVVIITWNVRRGLTKGIAEFISYIKRYSPDIIAVQDAGYNFSVFTEEMGRINGYHVVGGEEEICQVNNETRKATRTCLFSQGKR